MKYINFIRRLGYLCLFVFLCLQTACKDESIVSNTQSDMMTLHLSLNLPVNGGYSDSRVSGTNTGTDELDYTTEQQRYIKDFTVLLLQNDKVIFQSGKGMIDIFQGKEQRMITMEVPVSSAPVDVMILLNPQMNGISENTLAGLVGKSKQDIHDELVFAYPVENGKPVKWDIMKRYLPMFGMAKGIDISRTDAFCSCNIYRSLAKMALKVDDECKTFELKEVYLYYMEKNGYFMSIHEPNADVKTQYTIPDVPDNSTQTKLNEVLKYDVEGNIIENLIYLLESDNQTPKEGKEELKLVVGGYFNGGDKLNYYRIDMSDEKDKPYDIIRNHSYVYNITKVDNPGPPTPEEALYHVPLKVVVEDWTEQYMRGLSEQYTLTTSKSIIVLDDYKDTEQHTFMVWTDYVDGWSIETANGDIVDSATGESIDWLKINTVSGTCNTTVEVKVNAKKTNLGYMLTNRFWINAGNIRKEITVVMPEPPTANCYVVGDSSVDGEYKIIVNKKGNGKDGTRPEDVDIVDGDENTSPEDDAALQPATLGIIWETEAGLISLKNADGNYVTGDKRVAFNELTNTLEFKTNLDGATIGGKNGGNALIGAFDKDGNVIWSWHIWVCPEMYDSSTGQIKENKYLENWTISGYYFLDRNLGALSNQPLENSVATMGLQYQWGRKDPFIGPAYSNDNFTGHGLLPVVHYYKEWGVNGILGTSPGELQLVDRNVEYTIANPTQLVYWDHEDGNPTALVSLDNGGFLWGTDDGLSENLEVGTKTIYDPCPVGYRVPPVDAFVFESVYPMFPEPIETDYTTKETIEYGSGDGAYSVEYYENEYFRYYFVPDYEKTAADKDDAKVKGEGQTRFVRFLKLGKYEINQDTGKETFKSLDFYTKDEIESVLTKGYEYVFIQWYNESKEALTAPIYYEVLNSEKLVNVENAAFFRLVKPTNTKYTSSVYKRNFNYNMINIPFNAKKDKKFTRQWNKSNRIYAYMGKFAGDYTEGGFDPNMPKETMIGKKKYYGFYLNYGGMDEPKMENCTHQFKLADNNPSTITWLPLTGAYDPTKGVTFKDGAKTIRIEAGSSITVNSFLWTNSSVSKERNQISVQYPGGIALHGAEPRGNYSTYYGRHIHAITAEDVQADRHYTSAVRCVKDKKKVNWSLSNSLTQNVDISARGEATITFIAVTGSWKLIDPGKPWLQITPDKGEAMGGDDENNITLKVKEGTEVGSEATIKFQVEGDDKIYSCTVKVIGE